MKNAMETFQLFKFAKNSGMHEYVSTIKICTDRSLTAWPQERALFPGFPGSF